ncbi:LOW QUALITY PROTEIN: SUMO-specific isopeptidase USPL1-like [Takifugu rubripes]|uniref:LOW QUALITY PROTEIN: SUMO-specific isopeptidase USPL1-like n=1 Tax=Takifugu rubripes TaxID=31033 RepID=UPI0011458ED0|nr:LOW QUALITY PROTEIN: SUMO-specific isopeptidase USPL1 [Takifugu rubripes]
MDPTRRSGLSLSGEDTDLEALSSPLVGYLGKVQKRAALLENCPWCTSKGLTFALRSYHVNLHESIPVCTNPQCLFPLVSRSLEDILASLVPVDQPVGSKRKNTFSLGREDPIEPDHKRKRFSDIIAGAFPSPAEQVAPAVGSEEQTCLSRADVENGYDREPLGVELGSNAAGGEALVVDKGPEKVPCSTEAFNLLTSPDLPEQRQPLPKDLLNIAMPVLSPHCGAQGSEVGESSRSPHETLHSHSAVVSSPSLKDETVSSQHEAARGHTSLSAHEHFDNIQPEDEDVEEMKSSDLLPLPGQLFWPNSENLCWLDSMLVALVNCKSLKRCRPAVEPQESCVWRLMREYEDICSAVPGRQQPQPHPHPHPHPHPQPHPQPHPASDEVVMVSNNLLRKTNTELQRLRMWIFQQLQPKLHCKLGKEETPVFALPLLLAMDTWAEPLFQSVLRWEFRCDGCSVATQERVRKTLPTFTDVVPDWLPLHAVHLAPCNTCWRKHQRRTMTLESLPPVFGLHFVQGLPDNDVRKYSFSFNGNLYGVSTVIQYNQQLRHFVTWVCSSNGVWLEYDDLKHPECKTHGKLPIPAEEMHIVFWEVEVEEGEGPAACAPSSSFPDNPPPEGQMGSRPADGGSEMDERSGDSPERSLLIPHNDTAIVCALSAPGDGSHVTDPTAADASIGSTTLLDTFEGLSHDDIITFTLLDITPGFDIQPVNDSGPVQSCGAPTTSGTPDSAPDSSSAEPPTASVFPKVDGNSCLEATHVTGEAVQESGRCEGTQRGKKADLSKMDPVFLPPASSEPLIVDKSLPSNPTQASPEATRQASPVSSSDSLSLAITQEITQEMPSSFENRRWSYLLSKNPQFSNKKPEERLAPVTLQVHSTPNPVRRAQGPGRQAPNAQLGMEDGSLPLKAAAMYHSFGIKSSVPQNAAPVLRSAPSHHNTTSPPSLDTRDHVEVLSSGRCGSRSSKSPPCLNHTEALRYKLIKKLKAKKKKLAKLNGMLGYQGPDSTDLTSPSSVSSTYGGSLLLDLLSPATTASHLSPDSTSVLDMIATGQGGVTRRDSGGGGGDPAGQRGRGGSVPPEPD